MISEIKYGLFKYEIKDYYAILGVPIDANAKEVRNRYLKIAYKLHPDTCSLSDPKSKKRASQVLSKLVNPAYENLYKDKARRECQLILAETARKIASKSDKMTLSTKVAKKLHEDSQDKQKFYRQSLQKISQDQYDDLSKILAKIAMLSELNMVYAVSEEISKGTVPQTRQFRAPIGENTSSINNGAETSSSSNVFDNEDSENLSTSRLSKLINSAKQRKEQGNIQAGILDLREALKLDPNDSTTHALIASLYLLQDNNTYARVHLNKAIELDPDNATVKETQKEMEIKTKADKPTQKSTISKGKKSKDKKDKKGKKEPPKIFGIPLW